MSTIKVKFNDGILSIEKLRTRQTEDDYENVDITAISYKKKYKSKIKVTDVENKNKILLVKEIEQSNEQEVKDSIVVYSVGKKIYYKIAPINDIYKIFVKVRYKVLKATINSKYIKFTVFAYLKNKYNIEIEDISFNIDSNNYKKIKLKTYEKAKSKIRMLLENNTYNFRFKILDLLKSNEEINNYVSINIKINGVDVQYKLGIRDKRIKRKKLAKKYYNLPMKSKYVQDYAIHIRRTIAGNLIVVKRVMEPIEKTLKFRLLENKLFSAFMYKIGKVLSKKRKRKINIFYEKFAAKSEEGVYDLYEKCKQSKKTKNYFVIDKNSEDYNRIKNDKNVIKKYSFKYYWIIYNASWFIASEAPSHLNVLRSNNKYFRRATYDKKFVFLQHGIIYMKNLGSNSSFKKGKEGESQYMIVSSEKERDIVVDMLHYNEDQLLKTGLGMYSKIKYNHINNNSDDVITIMLTWKPYEEQLYNFEESTYYQFIVELYNMIKKYVDKGKVQIVAHPKVFDLLNNTDMKDNIWQGKISDIIEKTKLLITDYSSICYNAFYQGAGVIFFQPDLDRYELENGKLIPNEDEYIGIRTFSIEELEQNIQKIVQNKKINLSLVRNNKFEENYKTINEFCDGKNINRIHEELEKLNIV